MLHHSAIKMTFIAVMQKSTSTLIWHILINIGDKKQKQHENTHTHTHTLRKNITQKQVERKKRKTLVLANILFFQQPAMLQCEIDIVNTIASMNVLITINCTAKTVPFDVIRLFKWTCNLYSIGYVVARLQKFFLSHSAFFPSFHFFISFNLFHPVLHISSTEEQRMRERERKRERKWDRMRVKKKQNKKKIEVEKK